MRLWFLLNREYWPCMKWFGSAFARLRLVGGEPVEPTVREFYGRGFLVLMSDRFAEACLAHVTDPWLRSLPLVGSVDQVADSTDLLSVAGRADHLRALFEGEHSPDIHGDPDY